ncbi:MAG: hypothetical protein JWN78_751, partial [Bacteroidota bacterium]|nr:hypothetical protein [Bacteroidota bacterium]
MIYKIKPTLSLKDKGAAVSNLKEALKKILTQFPNQMGMNDSDPNAVSFMSEISKPEFSPATEKIVRIFQSKMMNTAESGKVDEVTADAINKLLKLDKDMPELPVYTVSGTVTSYENFPVVGKSVKAFDKDLRKEESLGSYITDKNGFYTISYTPDSFARAEKENADLFIRISDIDIGNIFTSNNNNKTVKQYYESPVLFNATSKAVINAVLDKEVYRSDSEFTRYEKSLAPLLDGQGVKIKDLTEEDIQFLTNETGIIVEHLSLLVKVHTFGNDENRMPEIFYGLLRQNLPNALKELLSVKQQKLREALMKSIDQNIISADLIKQVDIMLVKLLEDAGKLLTELTKDTSYTGIGAIIARAQISDILKQKSISLFLLHNDEEFDKAITADPELSQPKVQDEIKFVFAAKKITADDLDLLSLLSNTKSKLGLVKEKDIARLGKNDWIGLIKISGIPPEIIGNNEEERAAKYAGTLYKKAEKIYPTQVLQTRLQTANDKEHPFGASKDDILLFLNNNPDYDIRSTSVSELTKENSGLSFSNITDKGLLINNLKGINRLQKITISQNAMFHLYSDGITSAFHVAQIPRVDFMQIYTPQFGDDASTAEVYANAVLININASLLGLQFTPTLYTQLYGMYGDGDAHPASETSSSTWQNIFGTLNSCDCEHCMSVYSPAAYFTDLLNFLQKKAPTAFATLMERRPDLKYILLNCANTNTPMPYIDLVNEILSSVTTSTLNTANYQTTWTAEELSANPENFNPANIKNLRDKNYPFSLPYNDILESTRIYFKHLGVELHELMEVFIDGDWIDNLDIATEHLGLSPLNAFQICRTGTWNLNPYFGFNEEIDLVATLKHVDIFLQKVSLSYIELLQLLNCSFVNPLVQIKIKAIDNEGLLLCNPAGMELDGLDNEALKRIYKFISLSKKTGWSFYELDQCLSSIQVIDISRDVIKKLSCIKRLQDKFKIPLVELLMLWGYVDSNTSNLTFDSHIYIDYNVDGQPPVQRLFEKLFLNKAVIETPDAVFGPPSSSDNKFLITPASGSTLETYKNIIIAALQISEPDLMLLLSRQGSMTDFVIELSDLNFSLQNLVILYRYALLSRILNISISELLQIKRITNWSYSPIDIWKFTETVEFIKNSKFNIEELRYLLNSDINSLQTQIIPLDGEIIIGLDELGKGLKKIMTLDFTSLIDSLKFNREEILPRITDKAVFKQVQELIIDNRMFPELLLMAREQLLSRTTTGIVLDLVEDATDIKTLDNFLTAVIGYIVAQFSLFNDKPKSWLIEQLKDKFHVDRDSMNLLVNTNAVTIIPVFFKLLIYESGYTAEITNAYKLLNKEYYFINKLKLKADELKYINKIPSSLNATNLLKLDNVPFNNERFTEFTNLIKLVQLRDALPNNEVSLFDLLEITNQTNAVSVKSEFILSLKQITGWNETDLNNLTSDWTSTVLPVEYKNGLAMEKLKRQFDFLHKTGSTVSFCLQYIDPKSMDTDIPGADDPAVAEEAAIAKVTALKNFVKSKYDNKQWLKIAKPLSDKLRIKRRDALISNLIYNPPVAMEQRWINIDELYEYLLIDVQMDACMLTSRIKQAISSVQLFIDRVLMGLEEGTIFNTPLDAESFADQWKKWRKVYRIWEANRKIFLYPENWIEPTLRDNKTPFFKELENQLLQNEITNETVEDALHVYLEKLDNISRLEIVGMHHQYEDSIGIVEPGINILHVFGRTYSEPHIYYYCTLENNEWTSWEKVDVDIQGDHLIPVVLNRRVHLFWPLFTEKADEPSDNDLKPPTINPHDSDDNKYTTASKPKKYYEVKLAWSEYKGKKWIAKKVSKDPIRLGYDDNLKNFQFLPDVIPVTPNSALNKICIYCASVDHFELCSNQSDIQKAPGYDKLITNSPYVTDGELFKSTSGSDFHLFKDIGPDVVLLSNFYKSFKVLFSFQSLREAVDFYYPGLDMPLFFMDNHRTFYSYSKPYKYIFEVFYHPFVFKFLKEINKKGIKELFTRKMQELPINNSGAAGDNFNFNLTYNPNPDKVNIDIVPVDKVDFDYTGSYSIYNWELFFHIPLLIATQLSKNQKFEEARKWFHFIFDPTLPSSGSEGVERFWITKPFYELVRNNQVQTIEELLSTTSDDIYDQIENWEKNPFQPHVIARLRPEAYMKNVMMKYIDNLIAWGDQLYMQDTIETINEATQLYVMAAKLLGKQPEKIVSTINREEKDFEALNAPGRLDDFSNAVINIENYVADFTTQSPGVNSDEHTIKPFYFCFIPNEKLLKYWETIAERLFRIRHCMNISGVVRSLPLFEPPIDPALLVRATAAGMDISNGLDIDITLPNYRFNVMIQKANEVCNDVKSLGMALLSAIEKRDAEKLALIRSGQELKMLDLVKAIKDKQVQEAGENLNAILKSKETVEERKNYYAGLVNSGWNSNEKAAFALSTASTTLDAIIATGHIHAGALALIPEIILGVSGFGGTPHSTLKTPPFYEAVKQSMDGLAQIGHSLDKSASLATNVANYQRRSDEWNFQLSIADKELQQMDKQILVAEIRLAIAEKDMSNHLKQIENSKEIDDYMRSKFSNQELYDWM